MINHFYLREGMREQLKQAFAQDPDLPVLALGQFLENPDLQATGWRRTTIPDQYNYEMCAEHPIQKLLRQFIASFAQEPIREPNRRFSHRDFTLLHDHAIQQHGIMGLLFLDDWDEAWGGQVVFMKDGELLGSFTPQKNTFLIAERKEGVQYFIKYVNHRAQEHSLRIISA